MKRESVTPYQRFYSSLQTSATRKNYVEWLKDFCEYAKISPDGLVALSVLEVEDLIFNYIQHLKLRVEKGTLKANSCAKESDIPITENAKNMVSRNFTFLIRS